MKQDISTREDIIALVNAFYSKVRSSSIGHFFDKVVNLNWESHLPKMYDFWEGIVFGKAGYTGNPVHVHKNVHALHESSAADFSEWIRLFAETADEMFEGERAELIKQRASSIATVLLLKVTHKHSFGP